MIRPTTTTRLAGLARRAGPLGLAVVLAACPGAGRRGARPGTAEQAEGVVVASGDAIDLPRALVAHCESKLRILPTEDPYARFEECVQDDAQYQRRRTQLQERLIAASNERCAEYKERLQQVQVRSQPTTSDEGSTAAGDMATAALGALTVAYPPAAAVSGLLGAAQLVSGVRAAPPKQFTSGLTVQVVSLGIDTRRASILQGIRGRQQEAPSSYPVEAAVSDALLYHQACSMVAGLEAAGEALATTDPGVARVRAEFATDAAGTAVSSIARARGQLDGYRQRIATAAGVAPPGTADAERGVAEEATRAARDVVESRAAEAAGAKRRVEAARGQLGGTGDPRRRNALIGELDGEVTRAVRASVEVDEAMERARAAVEALEARADQAARAPAPPPAPEDAAAPAPPEEAAAPPPSEDAAATSTPAPALDQRSVTPAP
jgi:hypothetical protein